MKRWTRRHGAEGAIRRIDRDLPVRTVLENWTEFVSARRTGRVVAELVPGDQVAQAITQFAVLRSLGCPAAICLDDGRYVVTVNGAVVSPQAKTFRAPGFGTDAGRHNTDSYERRTVDQALAELTDLG